MGACGPPAASTPPPPPPAPGTAQGKRSSVPHSCAGSEGAPVLHLRWHGGPRRHPALPPSTSDPRVPFPTPPLHASEYPVSRRVPPPRLRVSAWPLSVMPAPRVGASQGRTHVLSSHPFKNNRKGTFPDPTSFFSCCPSSASETCLKNIRHPPIFTFSAHILNPLRPPLLFLSVQE